MTLKDFTDTLDVAAKIAIAVVGGLWVLYTYPDSREKDFRKSYWDRQTALYFDATETASKIATLPEKDPDRSNAVKKFWELYFGPMVVVEAKCERCDDVDQKMIQFGRCLTEPGATAPKDRCQIDDFKRRAFELGKACRDSIGTSWDEKLQDLRKGCPAEGQPCPHEIKH